MVVAGDADLEGEEIEGSGEVSLKSDECQEAVRDRRGKGKFSATDSTFTCGEDDNGDGGCGA